MKMIIICNPSLFQTLINITKNIHRLSYIDYNEYLNESYTHIATALRFVFDSLDTHVAKYAPRPLKHIFYLIQKLISDPISSVLLKKCMYSI